MTQFFELNPIRKVASNGTIDSVGLEWTEQASWRQSSKLLLWAAAIPLAAFTLIVGVLFTFGAGNPVMLIDGIAFAIWIFCYMKGTLPKRSVVLRRDGKISVPHGIPGMQTAKSLIIRQPDLVGFEIGPAFSGMQQDWTSTVQAVSRTGETVTVSKFLHREEAREVVVGLNLALREMRVSVGTEPMQAARNVGPRVLVD